MLFQLEQKQTLDKLRQIFLKSLTLWLIDSNSRILSSWPNSIGTFWFSKTHAFDPPCCHFTHKLNGGGGTKTLNKLEILVKWPGLMVHRLRLKMEAKFINYLFLTRKLLHFKLNREYLKGECSTVQSTTHWLKRPQRRDASCGFFPIHSNSAGTLLLFMCAMNNHIFAYLWSF